MKRNKPPVVRTVGSAIVLSGRTRVLLQLKTPPAPGATTTTFYDPGLRSVHGELRSNPNVHDRDA